ncbi:hypothetical protein K493DRAFT_297456 [Basidiobolus meristosporus CBS 931.73]|uniref:Uncharacterized protein n=1 Tax=Basidiobolus meristosporus CBS 931.73 TaxID=1314790 RepID=A0A1Y1YZS0_9FUNG|nr:hypothetical protein K493DRAFT_297456 [Basidiobolus meristosporus CBS 931.73]|eukprot:ORY03449.1 hypothetical protein K493DRAFT_297456 [Basidiobolus meristosporus CBS 931.73]
MQLSFLLLVSVIASLQAISATPLGDSQVAYTNEPCVEQLDACYQDTSVPSQEYQPSIEEGDDSEMSEPMQTSETSAILQHALYYHSSDSRPCRESSCRCCPNLNKGFNVKYQTGPGLELEGGANALEYAKQKGAEHSDDSASYPYVLMHPTQDVQYTTLVAETEQNVQYN